MINWKAMSDSWIDEKRGSLEEVVTAAVNGLYWQVMSTPRSGTERENFINSTKNVLRFQSISFVVNDLYREGLINQDLYNNLNRAMQEAKEDTPYIATIDRTHTPSARGYAEKYLERIKKVYENKASLKS